MCLQLQTSTDWTATCYFQLVVAASDDVDSMLPMSLSYKAIEVAAVVIAEYIDDDAYLVVARLN